MSVHAAPPVLSTPADEDHFQQTPPMLPHQDELADAQLDIQYEIRRTIEEIRCRKWRRVGLQFPDEMLGDAPRVLVRLRKGLEISKRHTRVTRVETTGVFVGTQHASETSEPTVEGVDVEDDIRLTILGDTSYGSCCVDEIAAEHIAADGVVHYGRACLSPTQRLPVVYVFTAKLLDHEAVRAAFSELYPDKTARVCLLADVPWQHHIAPLVNELHQAGFLAVFGPQLIHDPSSAIPNRALPLDLQEHRGALQDIEVFHVGDPPTALLLTLATKVRSLHVHSPETSLSNPTSTFLTSRRRYASVLRLSSAAIIGILVNTLSVKNYMTALEHVQSLISDAGKKSYTFVVGKLNPAKLANFAEVGGWVVIGCWESSLVDSKDFLVPVITPFELDLALQRDDTRVWGQEWVADFQTLLHRKEQAISTEQQDHIEGVRQSPEQEQESDDEPPEYDLRTGRYISSARPLAAKQVRRSQASNASPTDGHHKSSHSTALINHTKGDLAIINGVVSPGANFLRTRRDWQGLGSDFEIAYDREEDGTIQGAVIEQGRIGVAKSYTRSKLDLEG